MNKVLQFMQRFPVLLAVALFLSTTLFCWFIFVQYKNTNIYYLSTVVSLLVVFLLIIGAIKYQDRKIASGLLVLTASFLLVLTMSDFYLITFCYDTSGPGGENVITHRRWYNKFVSNNQYGFWERSVAEYEDSTRKKDEIVIAAVGDSFTWGQGLKGTGLRLTEQLEKRLNQTSNGEKISVLNFGKGGADTVQEIQIVDKFVSKIHPDIVLICYISNDVDSDSFITFSNDCGNWGERLSTITPSVNFIYWRLIGPAKYKDIGVKYMKGLVDYYENPVTFTKHMNDLSTLFKDVRKIGAQPIFVLLPFPHMWKMFPKSTRDAIYNRIKTGVTHAGVPIIDLSYIEDRYTLDEFQVNPFDGHPNARIHAEFAQGIYGWLVDNRNLVPSLGKP
jgi:hypothetical protein